MHICFFHLTDEFKADNPYNMNIAEDVSINQLITGLPGGCVTLQSLSKILGKKLEPNRGSWYYYREIEDFANKHPDKCMPGGIVGDFKQIDDHTMWPSDISEAERKLYENQIKSKLKETADAVSKQAGSIPGELKEILELIKDKPPVFNWRKFFRRMVGNNITNNIQLTRMRPSRRIPDGKGVRLIRKPNVLVGVDTSGSINTEDLNAFFSEIHHMYKTGVSITILECDTKIQHIFEYKGSQNIQISGRGGTSLSPIVDYYKANKEYNCCVVFTDGYCDTNLPFCRNFIWVITKNGDKSNNYSPGNVIFIS